MAKFKLNPDPTFKAKVGIYRPGVGAEQVEFVFKYRNEEDRVAFIEALDPNLPLIDVAMEIVCGWNLEDAFTKENIELLANNYSGSPYKDGSRRHLMLSIWHTYLEELTGARLGN